MTAALSPILQYFDNAGQPLAGGKLYTYEAGTTDPLPSYTDRSGDTPNTNPVILDAAGRAQVWLADNVPYKLILQTAGGVTLDTTDNFYAGIDPSQLIGVQTLTGSGVFTPSPGTNRIRIKMIGGGGAGGGAPATTTGQCSGGTGGGSGAYVEAVLTSGFNGAAYTAGFPGVATLGGVGGDGGDSNFGPVSADGGVGGVTYGPTSPPLVGGYGNTALATGGYLNVPGRSGGNLIILNLAVGFSGAGADSQWGAGGGNANVGPSDGTPARGYGAGGAGASLVAGAAAQRGGAGGPGYIVIEEYA